MPKVIIEIDKETFDHYQVSQHVQAALAAAEKRSATLAEELAEKLNTK